VTTDVLVVRATYLLAGTSSPCSQLRVVPRPDYSMVVCHECAAVSGPCLTQSLFVNCTVPAEDSTWGRVKALYR
jgi:hypothetical protein